MRSAHHHQRSRGPGRDARRAAGPCSSAGGAAGVPLWDDPAAVALHQRRLRIAHGRRLPPGGRRRLRHDRVRRSLPAATSARTARRNSRVRTDADFPALGDPDRAAGARHDRRRIAGAPLVRRFRSARRVVRRPRIRRVRCSPTCRRRSILRRKRRVPHLRLRRPHVPPRRSRSKAARLRNVDGFIYTDLSEKRVATTGRYDELVTWR